MYFTYVIITPSKKGNNMKFIKLSLAAALMVSVAFAEEEKSDLGVSTNIAMTSNYVWRGMTQTKNSPAIQGGFDLEYKGVYAGIWGSNVNFGDESSMEADFYAGYAGEVVGLGYDIGLIQYAYPNEATASNFGEAYIGLSYDFEVVAIGATYSYGFKTNDLEPDNNIEATISAPLPMGISVDAAYGDYDTSGSYYLVGVNKSFGKFDFTLAYSANDANGNTAAEQNNVIGTIATSF